MQVAAPGGREAAEAGLRVETTNAPFACSVVKGLYGSGFRV